MPHLTKAEFVALLDAAQITEHQRERLHALFEARHPDAHQAFLQWLGVGQQEIDQIRRSARAPH